MMAMVSCGRAGPGYCCAMNVALPQLENHRAIPPIHHASSLTRGSLPPAAALGASLPALRLRQVRRIGGGGERATSDLAAETLACPRAEGHGIAPIDARDGVAAFRRGIEQTADTKVRVPSAARVLPGRI